MHFSDKIDNSAEYPFIPKIKVKHNAKVALDEDILRAQENKEKFFENIVRN